MTQSSIFSNKLVLMLKVKLHAKNEIQKALKM
jgi:hypothetical protein